MKKNKHIIASLLILSPSIVFASGTRTLSTLINSLSGYLNQILILLMLVAVVVFVFYVFKYFIQGGADTKRAEAASYVMWSLIGFFVIFSIWGIVNILINTFGFGTGSPGTWTSLSSLFPS